MIVYNSLESIPVVTPSVVTVGAFDGLHLGHAKILHRLLTSAEESAYRPVVVTFKPHPRLALDSGGRAPMKILTTNTEREELFRGLGVPFVLEIPFTRDFSKLTAAEFVKNVLVDGIGAKKIIVGYDHLFGRNREGNESELAELGAKFGFTVEKVGPETVAGTIVSSTKIRTALDEGKPELAARLLGYFYAVEGIVVEGERLGRKLGYPTANIEPDTPDKLLPKNGIYLVRSKIGGETKFGMANLGNRPTIKNGGERRLEVNYFDFSGDLYGKTLRVEFLNFLRDEKRFSSLEELVENIRLDEEKCKMLIK